jgi:hypothetical protein
MNMKRELHNSCCKTISITQVAINNMKLFTALALVANVAAANAALPSLRNGLTGADLPVYVAADNVDVDAADASSHQTDAIVNQAHVADEVSDHYFFELCRPHIMVLLIHASLLLFAFASNLLPLTSLRLKRRMTHLSTCVEFNLRVVLKCTLTWTLSVRLILVTKKLIMLVKSF